MRQRSGPHLGTPSQPGSRDRGPLVFGNDVRALAADDMLQRAKTQPGLYVPHAVRREVRNVLSRHKRLTGRRGQAGWAERSVMRTAQSSSKAAPCQCV